MEPENIARGIAESRLAVSRRRALGLGGTIGLGTLLAACTPDPMADVTIPVPAPTASDGAVIQPQTVAPTDLVAKLEAVQICGLETEEGTPGPYYFDVDSIRSDIRENRPGTTLQLALRVLTEDCAPLPNTVVELWQCDAGGIYSGFEVASKGGDLPGRAGASDGTYSADVDVAETEDDGTYLRGAQVADGNGIVQFTTIVPGWYRGRTTHIHVKVHADRINVLTAQLYFDDDWTDAAYEVAPYRAHAPRDTRNTNDRFYSATGLLTVEAVTDGYLAYTNLGL